MREILFISFLFTISTINIYAQTTCPFENLCESCIEEGGFYCGDDPDNWTYYSPHGCVPHYYLNDGWEDCEDGSDEGGASPTLDCEETEDDSLCESCIEEGGFYCGDDPDNWTYYSPDGCVPHYYLNDGWEDCEDGSDEGGALPTVNCGEANCTLNFVYEVIGQIVNIQAVEFPPGAELVFTVNGNEIESIDDAIGLSFIVFLQPVTICVFYSSDDCPDGIEFCETLNLDDILNGGGEDEGCTAPNGIFYEVGSELFLNECEYLLCQGPENWSDIITIEDCVDGLGCYDEDDNFYALGEELFFNDCEYIFCEAPNNWSDINTIEGCFDNLGCFDENGVFYEIGSELYISECEYMFCESPGNWSGLLEIPGCNESDCEFSLNAQELDVDNDCGNWTFWLDLAEETEDIFWDFGDGNYQEGGISADYTYDSAINNQYVVTVSLYAPNCGIIFLDYLVVVDCSTDEGCYSDDGDSYAVGEELFINDCEYIYCESPGNWSDLQVVPGCGIDCDFIIEASPQDDIPCDLNWLFQLNGIEEETDNVFWDFGDGTTGEGGWLTEHLYETDGIYLVTAFVFTPSCQLVTVVTEIVIDGCDDGEDLGCYNDNGAFYDIGSEWFFTDCEYIYCESPGNWSAINVLEDCLGCFDDDGTFYDLGSELFIDDSECAFIFCETPNTWSDVIVIPDCEGAGCYSENGDSYAVGEELFINDCEYIYCESPGNWSDLQVVPGCGIDCDFIIEASPQDDIPCDLNWLFQLNGIEEETDNVFWDFGDGTTGEGGWLTEHLYETDGIYLVTAFVFTPSCQLVTVVTEIVIEGCNEQGCFSDDGVFYNIGDVLEVSDDWCENYTCSSLDEIGLEYGFTPNWEIYPECFQVECVDLDQINNDLLCPFVYVPVCGCNGLTYNNECEAFFYGGVTNWTDGPCEEGPENCEIFYEWYINPNGVFVAEAYGYPEGAEIEWWVNGDLYVDGNVIEYNMSNTLEPLDICVGAETEECEGFEYCETIFPAIDDLGCYEGGQFYPIGYTLYLSECEYVVCEWIQTWSDVVVIDDCEGNEDCIDESVIDPNIGCYEIWAPVCGCDGVTYSNDCYAYYYHGVTEWTEGECGGSDDECEIDMDGWYQGGYGAFEASNFPEGVNLHWYINGDYYTEGTHYIEIDNLEYYAYYENSVDICVGYFTEECGEVYTCETIEFEGNPDNPCTLELWSGVEGGIAMFEAYDYPEGATLFWMINGEYIENEGHYLEVDLNLIDLEWLEVCVGYEAPDCPYGVFACEEIELEGDCTLEMEGWVSPQIATFYAIDYPENANLIWTVNNTVVANGESAIDIMEIPSGMFVVCVGYETEDCGWVEVCDEYTTGTGDDCGGYIVASIPLELSCEWAFELQDVDQNCSVYWDFGDGTSYQGSVWTTHTYDEDGTYIVQATYYTEDCPNGVTLVITIEVWDCDETSVGEVFVDTWSVYPVPTSELLFVKGLPEGTWSAKLYDSTGRVVFVSDVQNGSQLDINGLSSGMYSMQIVGLKTSAKRVVVQR